MCCHIVDPAFLTYQGDEHSLLAYYKVGIGSLWLTRLGDLLRWPWLGAPAGICKQFSPENSGLNCYFIYKFQ